MWFPYAVCVMEFGCKVIPLQGVCCAVHLQAWVVIPL